MKSILRWIPATLLLLIFILLWATAVAGDMRGVISWYILMTGLPYVGGLTLAAILGIVVWKRQITAPPIPINVGHMTC